MGEMADPEPDEYERENGNEIPERGSLSLGIKYIWNE